MQANALDFIATSQFRHHLLLPLFPDLHLTPVSKPLLSSKRLVHAPGRCLSRGLEGLVHHGEDTCHGQLLSVSSQGTALVEHGHVHGGAARAGVAAQAFRHAGAILASTADGRPWPIGAHTALKRSPRHPPAA